MNYEDICKRTCNAAIVAGGFIREQRKTFSADKIEHKGSHDLVSYVDKEAEKMLVGSLKSILPEAGFITEEGTVEKDTDARFKWIIDPLDGTTNFVHGLPPYCVSIGLMEDEEIVVGVVYEVTMDECFYAWKGSKAYMNGEVIKVSDTPKLDNSLIAVGLAHASEDKIRDLLEKMDFFLRNTNGIRRVGSAAADLAYVACGRFDGFYQCNLSPWDVAGGALIVERAGGRVTDFSGGADYVFGREIIVSNPHIYEQFRKHIL